MTWIFKPDGTVMEVVGWPSPGIDRMIPLFSWAYPSPHGKWAVCRGPFWSFPARLEDVPKELRAKALLLGD